MFLDATANQNEIFGQIICMNTDSTLPGGYIIRSALGGSGLI